MTSEGVGAWLAAEEALAAGWLEERRKMIESPEMLCARCVPMTEATDGGLKTLLELMVKCCCLEVKGC